MTAAGIGSDDQMTPFRTCRAFQVNLVGGQVRKSSAYLLHEPRNATDINNRGLTLNGDNQIIEQLQSNQNS